jgi:L-alanine-DL-glutamate epimerase-like enolase superfamily enzyme
VTHSLRAWAETWPLVRPFAISRGTKTQAHVIVCVVEGEGCIGRGECVPYARYGESVGSVLASIRESAPAIAAGMDRPGLIERLPAGAARNAIDCALFDWEAKSQGRPAWDIAGVAVPAEQTTAETIALDDVEGMARAARLVSDRPLLKVKVPRDDVIARLTAVRRAAPSAGLIVDANEAWDRQTLDMVCQPLADLGVKMIEQPLPAGEDGALAGYRGVVPLCADESFHTAADLERLKPLYQIMNIKLDKAGGLTAALALARAVHAAGLHVMIGCMVATSLAIAPALLLGSLATVIDLDGPLWLARDRAPALAIRAGRIAPPPAELWG